MSFRNSYPDFADIEQHIRRARLERSVAIAQSIVDVIETTGRGLKRFARALGMKRAGALPQWARHAPARVRKATVPG